MKTPKGGILLVSGIIVLLSVLFMAWIGGLFDKKTESEEDIPLTAEAYLQKARQRRDALRFEEAWGSYRVAIIYAYMDGDKKLLLQATKEQADCGYWIGAIDSCIYRYNQALALAREQDEAMMEYDIYTKLQQVYMSKVDMESVMLYGQKIDSLMHAKDDKRLRLLMHQRLATEALMQGNTALAETYMLANERFLDSLSIQERPSLEYMVYWDLRNFYFGQKEYEKAKHYSRLYVEAGKRGFGKRQMAYMTYESDAILYATLKDRKAAFVALDSMKYGLTLEEKESTTNRFHYHEVKGNVHALLGEWKDACDEYRKALEIAEGTYIVGRAQYYQVGRLWGDALCKLKKYDEAREAYCLYLEYCKFQYGEESKACADIMFALANLEEQSGEIEAGNRYYMMAIDNCKKIVNGQLHYVSVQERNAFWTMFAPSMFAMSAYALKAGETQSLFTEKCYEALLFSKALLLETDRSLAEAVQKECSYEERRIYYEMLGLQNQMKALMNDYAENKERIEKIHERITEKNRQMTPIISKLGYTSFLTMGYQDIKHSLSDDEVLLDFTDFSTDDKSQQIAAFVVDSKQTHPKLIKLFTDEKIKKNLAGKRADFLYKEPYASEARKLIWEPLANEVKGKRVIYYVPSGILHRIALESLPLGDGSLLGEHYYFVRLTSAREIVKSRKKANKAPFTSACLFGALKYDMDGVAMAQEASHYQVEPLLAFTRGGTVRGGKRFNELPNAKDEINRIEGILRSKQLKVTTKTGAKGTEEAFLAMSGKAPQLLHIATHGFYYNTQHEAEENFYLKGYSDAMQLTGLIMAGGNRAWTGMDVPKGVQDGILTASSIAAMNLRGTDLVVLSACESGLGMATPEGVFGLQRAFKKAGAGTIIMSLWDVDDEAAKDFMIKFYEELADSRNKWDKRKAFEKAKAFVRSKTYIRKYETFKGDPYYWAAFVMLD